jgi:AcrR family transcriptional regulator
MEEIAAHADVARATLYNHFASKGEVVLALVGSIADDWLQKGQLRLSKNGSPCAAISDVLIAAANWFDAHPSSVGAFFYAMREIMSRQTEDMPPPTLIPTEWVLAAQKQGELTKELPAEVVLFMLDSVLRHHTIDLVRGRAKGKLATVVKKQLDVVMRRLEP